MNNEREAVEHGGLVSMIFSFGQSEYERIEVDVRGYECAPVGEYYDDNWLMAQIRIKVGGFRGTADAAILTRELTAFLAQLRTLFQNVRGTVEFALLEEQLHLRLAGDGKGHVELVGDLADQPCDGNRLHFVLNFDQSQLGASIGELAKVVEEFPVRQA
jgi:hypothetical protein